MITTSLPLPSLPLAVQSPPCPHFLERSGHACLCICFGKSARALSPLVVAKHSLGVSLLDHKDATAPLLPRLDGLDWEERALKAAGQRLGLQVPLAERQLGFERVVTHSTTLA